jgi:hypothetical protein
MRPSPAGWMTILSLCAPLPAIRCVSRWAAALMINLIETLFGL